MVTALLAGLAGATAQSGGSGAPANPSGTQRPFGVVLDAAHGGSDTGARLGGGILEKNVTLRMAERLGALLQAQGIPVTMTRDADVDPSERNRAETANHAGAAACLVLHATATGSGVHLFTSSLAPLDAGTPGNAILPWATAQAAYVTQSLRLESEVDEALRRVAIPVTMGRAAVAPMDHLTCPAVTVEVAPMWAKGGGANRPVTDAAYEDQVDEALAEAIQSWRKDRNGP